MSVTASRLFQRWNEWMHRRGSAKMVARAGLDYLERRYLWHFSSFRRLPLAGFLHTFWMNDPDQPHDHPWAWGRIILAGSYREWYHDGTYRDCGPGHIVWRRDAIALHRVELLSEQVTTIFWHWRRERTWGFLHPDGWRPTSKDGQDGRPLVGRIFPRKIGPAPKEVQHHES